MAVVSEVTGVEVQRPEVLRRQHFESHVLYTVIVYWQFVSYVCQRQHVSGQCLEN